MNNGAPMKAAFRQLHLTRGFITRDLDPNYKVSLHGIKGNDALIVGSVDTTSFVFVQAGRVEVMTHTNQHIVLSAGMYAAVPGQFTAYSYDAAAIVIQQHGYKGVFMAGGPIEHHGRMRYIDGCTDSLIIPPVKRGDPCMNMLHFPAGIDQTMHTHPSVRLGIVTAGHGLCWAEGAGYLQLTPGMLWCIEAEGPHKFATPYGQELQVIAFHPDSDTGPCDEDHPMLNRTIVDGVSAKDIPSIRSGAETNVIEGTA
jgi:hypothetical protein